MKLTKKAMPKRKKSKIPDCTCFTGTTDNDGYAVHYSDCVLIQYHLGFRPNFTESREHEFPNQEHTISRDASP